MFFILGTDGKEYGPVSVAKIQEWIAGGRANLQTKARPTNESEWRTLGDFPDFTGGAAPASAPVLPVSPAFAAVSSPAAAFAAPAGTLELAGRWVRLGAVLLDTIIGGFFALPGLVVLAAAGVFTAPETEPLTSLGLIGVATCCGGLLVLLIIQIYLLVTHGQTIGKKLLSIKIVACDTEEHPGFVKIILLRGFVNGVIGAIPVIGGIYALVDALFIFREDRRCIHDHLAGTKVVKA